MISQDNLLHDEKLHIILLGTGGPINNIKRITSSTAIIAGGVFILFDIGPGTYRNADLMRLPVAHISAIFLTHFHSDHIGDLGEANMLSWANGRTKPLEVYGPKGVEKVVKGFKLAYELDTIYRITHHGQEILPPEAGIPISKNIKLKDKNQRALCFDRNDLRVYAFEVDHSPVYPAFGYRVEYKGSCVIITGDTIKTDNLVTHSQDADIIICEAISYELLNNLANIANTANQPRFAKIVSDIQDYHMNPISAAKLAKEANVKKLVFVHITPPIINENLEQVFLKGINNYFDGEIVLGEDQMHFTLPV